jgi:mannose-6-phosphate isomerase-like protein (cupin superfamily)
METDLMNPAVLKVTDGDELLAVVVRAHYSTPGLSFFTPNHFPFQFGMHIRGPEDFIEPHAHFPFKELINLPVQEFFFVQEGKMEVGLYNKDKMLHTKILLNPGDMIVVNTPHDVKFFEKTKFVELKQGPYRGKEDEKKYFAPREDTSRFL